MPDLLLPDLVKDEERVGDRRIYGVAVAKVEDNKDSRGEGRVQVSYPWAPGISPWARVAVPMAGMNRGTYIIPQVGDEVLVAFENGDINTPYVIGSLWNTLDRPPITPGDILAPSTKRILRTGTTLAHEIELDDLTGSITITTATQQKITLDPTKIELSTTGGTASVALDVAGNVTIKGALSLTFQAPTISLKGGMVEVSGAGGLDVKSTSVCTIQAPLVKIN